LLIKAGDAGESKRKIPKMRRKIKASESQGRKRGLLLVEEKTDPQLMPGEGLSQELESMPLFNNERKAFSFL
jgi:hypothetical protein